MANLIKICRNNTGYLMVQRKCMLDPTIEPQTSIFSSPEQIRSRSSPVPVPDIAEIAIGENLVEIKNVQD